MNHHALNLHYVNGVPGNESMPSIEEFLNGNPKYGYEAIQVVNPPGTKFKYSGAGFIVLEHVLEALSGKKFVELTHEFLIKNELSEIKFETPQNPAHGFRGANKVPGDFLNFPRIAAGAFGTTRALQTFLKHLTQAYHSLSGSGAISHYTARLMLWAKDDGCREFMGCDMGLGIFVLEGGQNKWTLHQGANDGFRCLFLHCFHGPDQGKGLSILCNGELNGVQFIAEATQEILKLLSPQGIDPNLFKAGFSTEKLKQEEVVNTGYRELIFKAFEPRLPETIIKKGSPDPLAKYNLCVGGKIERVTNQLFARAENLLSDHEPIFDPELFGREGKIMDSWETVRHNAHHDELEFALKAPSTIHYVSLSTKYHFGNHAPAVRLEGLVNGQWQELLARVELEGHALMRIKLPETKTVYSKIKVQMFPDGGLSRLGLYKELPANVAIEFKTWDKRQSVKFSEKIPHTKKPLSLPFKTTTEKIQQRLKKSGLVDLASKALGADVISASNEHYGPAAQVISPYRPLNMFDGMESARSRIPGHHEEVTIRLAKSARLERIELDYSYFVNNNPMHVCIEGKVADKWQTLVPKTLAKCFAGNKQDFKLKLTEEVSELRVKAYPCGGLNRVHAWGRV
jgi:allantoicase